MTGHTLRLRTLAVLLCAAALTACEKNAVQDITAPVPSARIKFYNFGINAPAVNFYANDVKMTAVPSATGVESTTGIAYGGAAPSAGDLYAGIDAGRYTLSGRIAAATEKDRPISGVTADLAAGSAYSFYQSGFYDAAARTVDGFVVEDRIPAQVDYSVALVRFVHAIPNAGPLTLHARSQDSGGEEAVGGSVAYRTASGFVSLLPGTYDLSARLPGSASAAVVRTGLTFSGGRVYTVAARGDITVTSSTATNRPLLDRTFNR